MVVKKHKKPITIVKKENQKPKGVKQTFEVNKSKQEQEVLGNRAIEQRAEKKSEKNQAKTLPIEKEAKPKALQSAPLLKGDSIEVIKLFSHASASNMARLYPSMGESLNEKLKKEQKKEQQNAPVLEVNKGKKKQVKKSNIIEISKPTMTKEEKLSEKEPKVLKATEHKDKSEIPNNKASIKVLEKYSKSNFSDWFRENFSNFLESIKTEDKNINTSTGEAPVLSLRKDANPNRMENEKSKALKDVIETKENLSSEILKHTGQEQIQPVELEHKSNIVLSEKTEAPLLTPSSEGMQDYVSLDLPDKVRKGADALLQPTLEQSTLKLEEGSSRLSLEKEEGKAENIRQSKEEVEKLHAQANREEEQIIIQRREEIVQKQEKSLEEAYDGVSKFNESAKKEKSSYKKEIDGKVNKANSDANFKLKEGEKEAKKIQKEKEAEAKKKKRELKEKKKSQGFFSRVGSVIKSAVELITKAIDVIFDAMRSLVKAAIEKAKKLAVAVINVARAWIVEKLEAFKTWAKGMVDKYVKEYFPKIAKALNSAIDFVVDSAVKGVNAVADGLIKGVEALASALSKALDKVLATFQTGLKAAVQIAGAVLTGDFEGALKIAIQAVCDTLGIDSKPVFDFFEKAGKNMMKILKSPATFFKNLVLSVGKGIKGFKKNIVKHLKSGLFAWFTGAMSSVEINLPKKFDFKGILSLVMQVMGITYANIKARIIKRYPASEKVFSKVEKAVSIIQEIATSGPMVLWKKVKEKIGNLKEMVLSGIKGFVAFTLVKEGIIWLLSLLNPASAIVKVIKLLFDFVMFLVERFTQIKDFVLSIYNSITAIASGSLAKAAKAVEGAMAKSLPVIISLLARLAGLGGIGKTVQELIHKAGKPVNRVIDFVVDRAVKFAKKIFGKKKSNRRKKKGKIDKTLGKNLKFRAGKENHKLWITNVAGKIKVMVASNNPGPVEKRLKIWESKLGTLTDINKEKAKKAIEKARQLSNKTMTEAKEEATITKAILKDKEVTSEEKKKENKAENETITQEKNLQKELMVLFELFGEKIDMNLLIDSMADELFRKIIIDIKNKPAWEKFKNQKEATASYAKGSYGKNDFLMQPTRRSNIRKKAEHFTKAYLETGDDVAIKGAIKEHLIKSLKGSSEHSNYKPKIKSITIKDNKYTIKYEYEQGSQKQDFTVEFDFSKINDQSSSEVTQTISSPNLKVTSGKGRTIRSGLLRKDKALYRQYWSAKENGALDSDEKVDERTLTIFFRNLSRNTQGNANVLSDSTNLFDSSHLIANEFTGSGYRKGLNLIVTSSDYNRKTMKGAEDKIKDKVGSNIFNLTVQATWDILSDTEVSDEIKTPSLLEQIKNNSKIQQIDDESKRELADKSVNELSRVLLVNQDPQRVLKIDYDGNINDTEGEFAKIGCDVWMSKNFDFPNRKECS